jgi:glutathione S-transferase
MIDLVRKSGEDAMLELYHALISTCSQKVRLVLAEKQLAWKSHALSFASGDHLSAEYLKMNPNGVVPTLLDDGVPIVDSSVINEYLEDVYPDRPVRPRNPKEAARMRAWRQYIDEVPTPAIRPPSFNAFFVPHWASMTDEEFFEYTERLPLRKHFYRKMGRTGFSQADIDEALDKLGQTLRRMEQSLRLLAINIPLPTFPSRRRLREWKTWD